MFRHQNWIAVPQWLYYRTQYPRAACREPQGQRRDYWGSPSPPLWPWIAATGAQVVPVSVLWAVLPALNSALSDAGEHSAKPGAGCSSGTEHGHPDSRPNELQPGGIISSLNSKPRLTSFRSHRGRLSAIAVPSIYFVLVIWYSYLLLVPRARRCKPVRQ